MTQKMWVRKDGVPWWEVGCQCCGTLIGEFWTWRSALQWAHRHSWLHADIAYVDVLNMACCDKHFNEVYLDDSGD